MPRPLFAFPPLSDESWLQLTTDLRARRYAAAAVLSQIEFEGKPLTTRGWIERHTDEEIKTLWAGYVQTPAERLRETVDDMFGAEADLTVTDECARYLAQALFVIRADLQVEDEQAAFRRLWSLNQGERAPRYWVLPPALDLLGWAYRDVIAI